MKKFVIGAVAAASLVGGSLAVAAVNPLGIAGAQDGTSGTTVPAPSTSVAPPPAGSATPGTPNGADKGPKGPMGGGHGPRGKALEDTLKDLVANGTITQAQADAITSSLKAKIEAGGDRGGPRGHGFGGPAMGFGKDMVSAAAGAIGIDEKTLLSELKDDKTLAAVAKAHGVDPQKVIDVLVAASVADIDKAVADGKIPADKADQIKAGIKDRVTDTVNNGRPGRGPCGFGGPGGPGRPGVPGGPSVTPNNGDPTVPPPATPPSTEVPATPTTPAPPPSTAAPAPTTTAAPPSTPPGTAG